MAATWYHVPRRPSSPFSEPVHTSPLASVVAVGVTAKAHCTVLEMPAMGVNVLFVLK